MAGVTASPSAWKARENFDYILQAWQWPLFSLSGRQARLRKTSLQLASLSLSLLSLSLSLPLPPSYM